MESLFISLISALLCSKVAANWAMDYGPFRSFLYSNWIACDHSKDLHLDVSDIEVYFYDFQGNFNASYKFDNAVEKISSSYNLDVTRKLIFYVPGYRSHIRKYSPEIMRPFGRTHSVYLETFRDIPNVYLVIIDHSAYTLLDSKWRSYENSVMYTYYMGLAVGKVLADFRSKGIPSQNIHCIGHSLGSQILGVAGVNYFNRTQERVWRITGIDPAGPCFSNSFIEEQLRSGCADYVEVYHCSAGSLGTTSVLADIDFFFNEAGKIQPHCHVGFIPGLGESDAAKCSHKACVVYWARTVRKPGWYLATRCESYEKYERGECAGNEVAIAGYSNPGNTSGVFYVSTDAYDV